MTVPTIESSTLTKLAAGTSFDIDMPATRPDGDLYICIAARDNATDFSGVPAGWTSISNRANTYISYHAWYWVGDSEPSSYNLTLNTSDDAVAIIYRVSGADPTTPINAYGDAATDSTYIDAPSVTTTEDNCLVFRTGFREDRLFDTYPSTLIYLGETASSASITYAYCYGSKASAGSTGTARFSDTTFSEKNLAMTLAIAPEAVVTGYTTSRNGSNTSSTTVAVTLPAYSTGDLIVTCIDYWQDNNQTNDLTWAAGPDGETVTNVYTNYPEVTGGLNLDLPLTAIGWYIATDDYAGGTWNQTADIGTRYANAILRVDTGSFNASSPISTAMGSAYSTSDTSSPQVPAFTANANDADGILFNFISVDQDPFTGTPSGYTTLEELDQGRASMLLSVRDDTVTASESISAATYTIGGDSWNANSFIVRAPATGPDFNMKINIGDSWKDVVAVKINIGDTWKEVTDIKQNIGDVWKDV